MKILHVCETAIGGIASYLMTFAAVAPRGSENAFVIPQIHCEHIDPEYSTFTYPGARRGLGLTLGMIAATRRAMTDFAPDIVFFHSTFSLLALGAMKATGWKHPTAYIPHSWSIAMFEDKNSPSARAVRLVEGRLAGLADVVINVGEADYELAQQLGYRGQHMLVENPARPARADARNDLFANEADKLHLLFVGRFDRQKGCDLLLEAFARARTVRPDLRLHLVGAKVRASDDLALPEGVDLVGWVDKSAIDDWYQSADAVIIPSRWEGLPIVIPEAFGNGTPILASRRSCMDRLVEHGVTGEVFDLSVDAITACLVGLDKARLESWRPAARAVYEDRFSLPKWKRAMEAVIDRIALKGHAA